MVYQAENIIIGKVTHKRELLHAKESILNLPKAFVIFPGMMKSVKWCHTYAIMIASLRCLCHFVQHIYRLRTNVWMDLSLNDWSCEILLFVLKSSYWSIWPQWWTKYSWIYLRVSHSQVKFLSLSSCHLKQHQLHWVGLGWLFSIMEAHMSLSHTTCVFFLLVEYYFQLVEYFWNVLVCCSQIWTGRIECQLLTNDRLLEISLCKKRNLGVEQGPRGRLKVLQIWGREQLFPIPTTKLCFLKTSCWYTLCKWWLESAALCMSFTSFIFFTDCCIGWRDWSQKKDCTSPLHWPNYWTAP